MTVRVFVPADTTAASVGADRVAREISAEATRRGASIELVRNGSRGMFWLEPLVEVVAPRGRVAYGPVRVSDVSSLFEAGFLEGGVHALGLGLTHEIPWLKQQERLTFARVGVIDPLSLSEYEAQGGLKGLRRAVKTGPAEIVAAVTESGLRGRGGAAFPAGIKWQTVLNAPGKQKYIVANADEGDSGTFADRMLMEGDPYCLI
ncbi:MAG: formate dehydrogenase, partial [Planctomycetota bacterium]